MRTGEWLCTVSGCCVILTILTCASAIAQPAGPDPVRAHDIASLEGGLPPLETVPFAPVPAINAATLAGEALGARGEGPLAVASVHRTNISAFRAPGIVDESQADDDDRRLTWRLRFSAAGATSIGVGFTRYQMPPGGRLFVFTPDYQEILGPFTDAHNSDDGQLWVPRLPGTELVVEITVPADVMRDVEVEIGAVERGFLDESADTTFDDCQTDVVCSEANRYSRAVRSVAFTEVTISGTVWMCSGALINNTRQNRKLYFLTAYHCGGNKTVRDRSMWWSRDRVASLKVFWRHHSDYCGQRLARRRNQLWQSGSRFVAGNLETDFTLLELTRPLPESSTHVVHFAGWSRDPRTFNVVAGIHHPGGTAKSIAFDQRGPYKMNISPSWFYDAEQGWRWGFSYGRCSGDHCGGLLAAWDKGGTKGGSSGSPLFNGNQRILGQLWGGGGGTCGNERIEDEGSVYGWVKASWEGGGTSSTRLRNWLDPGRTGDVAINGIDAERARPNLVVRPTQVSDSTLYAGQTFTLFATVHNEGGGTAQATRLRWYHRPPGRGWTRFVTSNFVSALWPSQSTSQRFTTTAPSFVGTHRYAACVTSVPMENTGDNCSRSVSVTVRDVAGMPDLVVRNASVSDSTPVVGQQFRLYAEVRNIGTAASETTRLRYWRRPLEGNWELVGDNDYVPPFVPGRRVIYSTLLTAQPGMHEYTACVVPVRGEPSGSNCSRPYLTVTVSDAEYEVTIDAARFDRSESFEWDGEIFWRYWVDVTATNTGRRALVPTFAGDFTGNPSFLFVTFYDRSGNFLGLSLKDVYMGVAPWNPGEQRRGSLWATIRGHERSRVHSYVLSTYDQYGVACIGCEARQLLIDAEPDELFNLGTVPVRPSPE